MATYAFEHFYAARHAMCVDGEGGCMCIVFIFFMVDNFFLWMHKGFMNHSEDKFSFIYKILIEIGICHHR